MKRVILLTLAAALLIASASKVVLIADYVLNYDYISKVLCINRDKPEMKCNGKCHLAKQVAKQDETERKNKAVVQVHETIGELYVTQFSFLPVGSEVVSYPCVTFPVLSGFNNEVDHPPLNGATL